ncbi:MAG: SRPBCC domain-containing protein [Anaerolineales bacterium]|jgi:uncharacterized protein YndB with AHSA1/START domain|nr:SRPBCC domain-containing protein [Anaerolineales bacterium]
MSPESQLFEFTQPIQANLQQVFRAFTNATALKEWMCDVATLVPKTGGRIYMAWNSGFYAAGEFTRFEPDRLLAYSWFGRGEPAPTLVEVNLNQEGDHTIVKLTHSGLGSSAEWENMTNELKEGWATSLENLASVLEKGPDLRIVLRPMLGITIGDFDSASAARLGVPVSQGLLLDNVLEKMGAFQAGLRKEDVLVRMDHQEISDYASLASALNGHRAGDVIEVDFYRGPELHTIQMALSGRPIPVIAPDVPSLAEQARQRYAGLQNRLDELLDNASEAESEFKPSPEDWNAKEILAHLIHGERDGQAYVAEIVGSQVSWSDDYPGNLAMRTQATLDALPLLADLRAELKRLQAESIALYTHIPLELPQERKGTWWGLAYFVAEPPYHEFGHMEQIQTALQAARKS